MTSERRADGTLVVRSTPAIALLVAGGCLVFAVVLYFDPHPAPNQALGAGVGVVIGAVFVLAAESSEFVFDPGEQCVHWKRATLLKRDGGTLPFTAIHALALETYSHSRSTRGRRLSLVTPLRRIPLTTAYTGFTGGMERAAAEIQAVVGAGRELPLRR